MLKIALLSIAFLLSVIPVKAQNNSKEGRKVLSYTPSGNGYVVKNVNIEYGIGISEPGTGFAKLQWSMHEVSSDVIGYKYNGTIYNNSSACCSTDWTGPNLEDIGRSLKASFQIRYKGQILKTMNNDIISAEVNAYGYVKEIDPESDINDYSITNIQISTHSPTMDSHIGNAIRSLEQKKKEKAAKKKQARQADPASGSSSTGSFEKPFTKNSSSDVNKSKQKRTSTSNSQAFTRPNPAAHTSGGRENYDRKKLAEFQKKSRERQQKSLEGAQKSFGETTELVGNLIANKRRREAQKEAYWAEQRRKTAISRANNKQRMQAFYNEYKNISEATSKYIGWLKGEIKANPRIHYIGSVIADEKLGTGEDFYFAAIEITRRQVRKETKSGYISSQTTEKVYGTYFDTRFTVSSSVHLRVNPVTEYYTKLAYRRINKELKGSKFNTVLVIAAKEKQMLQQFLSRIEPVNSPYLYHYTPDTILDQLYNIKKTYPAKYDLLTTAKPTVDALWSTGKDNYSYYLKYREYYVEDNRRKASYRKSDAHFLIGLAADLGNKEAIAWKEEQETKKGAIADFKTKYNGDVAKLIADDNLPMLKNLIELNKLKLKSLYGINVSGKRQYLPLLHISAVKNKKEMIKYLVDAGASIEQKSSLGTPLLAAIQQASLPSVYELLKLGANPNVAANGYSSLMLAVSYFNQGDAKHKMAGKWLIQTLVEFDVKINAFSPNGRWSALHWAARLGTEDATRLLIKHGADINSKNKEAGQTPLHVTAHYNTTGVAKVLLEAGCDTYKENNFGNSAFILARRLGHREVKQLIKSYR